VRPVLPKLFYFLIEFPDFDGGTGNAITLKHKSRGEVYDKKKYTDGFAQGDQTGISSLKCL